ncbi:Asp-tRNA(Asn)/Glu-tRNA(Gln) amidotransferase GatCAB subunit C [Candidatus Shapirobacteria bacterium CG03_land_8_20_14_0_80_40_19]|uniref:Aspartyl/glutamyl-tRNA(Asn/Gln) amidotransferase subunit C n=4 Tax=Candidatus Shapironibacteriota TaxID=1752721 RepID=A0A2M7BAY3_9BACT|nr:MAG: Asp-tRNA(Asn)/Glu-tRNA(Gln) amidotransferase GatCAB subunit C [Candidatus Shapirobacteria bacterium CG11_big_fil_rev_8_21_14_0_20_40_12]PIV00267.1 MAG: Asp-tRNA(Asn)/Glu-tRNA(Gln) amidotransferase GatCAB subunit C [Candidatus Shapirobacteria bacterium CG03_land_8_20_14_0_80_40_19]PJC29073.1 MAG: Asp-tRNA(Asn)/Glu-tRNA(Gln) amidotransferase GatCAB subunit C [Candidatus Shapirobacteria bacterium CG_4_9_14_0_2_um_filter_40_11]PJC76841.1 MAG: Asp-tRNA(Asn)/Glu-tRNA(Gln) amidotransferase GatC
MARLTKDEIKHIAKLANLKVDDKQSALFAEQLSAVLDYFAQLEKAPTDSVLPLFNVNESKNVFREDKVSPCLTQKECLKNAKSIFNGYFKVKSIF